jgi:glutamate carboxypeptidase
MDSLKLSVAQLRQPAVNMIRYALHLDWIDQQDARLRRLVEQWANLNSGTFNLEGVNNCSQAVLSEFRSLQADVRSLDLPPAKLIDAHGEPVDRPLGKAIHLQKHRDAPVKVLLGIHIDTVYAMDDPFQRVTQLDAGRLQGPGVADAKGGLVVMLTALQALERSAFGGRIGWDVLINPDEEIGSPGSAEIWKNLAKQNHVGMLYEPALSGGALVAGRKGSGNFTAVVRGKAAHAGRDPKAGRNAIHLLGEMIVALAAMQELSPGISVNVGQISGGTAVNIVPDLAIANFNVRVVGIDEQATVERRLQKIVSDLNSRDGYSINLHGGFSAPPKVMNDASRRLMDAFQTCGRELGLSIDSRDTGGVCDGNRLAAAGLANIDSLGVRGGNLHSDREYIELDSLTERAKLSAVFLMKLAAGEINVADFAPPVSGRKNSAGETS